MATLRENIAFALWNDTNPEPLRQHMTLDGQCELVTSIGDGWTMRQDFALDWRLNKNTFLKLADVAIEAAHSHEF
jgi:hypothetical protein